MKYALLFYRDDERWASTAEAQRAERERFARMLEERGAAIHGGELTLAYTATTVRERDGETLITDGPFAETTEQLGGFFIIEARDLDEALELARAAPCEITEVRAIVEPS